jgi:hypothetical protein
VLSLSATVYIDSVGNPVAQRNDGEGAANGT